MNVFKQELKQNLRGLAGWSVGVALFILIYMPFMSAFVEEGNILRSFVEGLGGEMLKAMGLNPDLMFGALGFYGFLFTFVTLIAAIQAVSLGLSVLSKEKQMKTADFLLTKPVSRASIFLAKLLAALLCLVVTQAVFYSAASAAMLTRSDIDIPLRPFILISLTFSFAQLLFFAVGLFAAAMAPKIKSVTTVAMGISLGFFLLGMVSSVTGSEALRYLSPLKYFDNNYIMLHGAYETRFLIINLAAAGVLCVCAFLAYTRRDVKAV